MPVRSRKATATIAATAAALTALAGLSACGGGSTQDGPTTTSRSGSTTATSGAALPGTGRPPVTIGDKNFTEQFVLGELYSQALQAQGFTVTINRNIGPSEVTIGALESRRLDMYPEYLSTWDSSIAHFRRPFRTERGAYRAGQQYALAHGLQLLNPTPASSTGAIGVSSVYAAGHELHDLQDLRRVAPAMTLGAPPQFLQSSAGLPLLEQAYGFTPAAIKALDVGAQYHALDQGQVQSADVGSTDGQLTTARYTLLRDPKHVFGWGNVIPIVPAQVLTAEGPAFTQTIDRVSALLTTSVLRRLNAAVDISNEDPMLVAKQFLQAHGLVPA